MITKKSILACLALSLAIPTTLTADPATSWKNSVSAEKDKDYDTALKDIITFQSEGGDRYLALVRSGWLCLQKKDYPKAQSFYEAAQKISPSALAPYQGMSQIAYAQSDWKNVLRNNTAILRFDPGNYQGLLLTAEASFQLSDYATVIHCTTPLMNFYPEDPAPASLAAWAYLRKNEKHAAEPLFKRVLLLSPDYTYAQQGLDLCKAPR